MSKDNIVIGIAILALLGAGVAMFKGSSQNFGGVTEFQKKSFTAGLYAGDNRQFEFDADGVANRFVQGGGIATLTDANGGAYTLSASEVFNSSVFKFAAGGAGQEVIVLTLPNATSTAFNTALPAAGDSRSWIYDASALAAATTTTWTAPAGGGIDLIAYTTNDDVVDGAEFSQLSCWREDSDTVKCIVSELVHAD